MSEVKVSPETSVEEAKREIDTQRQVIARLLSQNLALQAELVRQTELNKIDQKTGLLSASEIENQLEGWVDKAEKNGESFAVFFGDVNRMKEVNDTQGHLRGDELLRRIGASLSRNFRQSDVGGRFGGDEFILISSLETDPVDESDPRQLGLSLKERAEAILHRFREGIEQDLRGIGFPENTGLSFGYAIFESGDSVKSLTERADMMMLKEKPNGRNATSYPLANPT